MFSDPQTVTIATVPNTLPRVGNTEDSATYVKVDGNVKLTIVHSVTKAGRERHNVSLDLRKIGADPLTTENVEYTAKVSFTIDMPDPGYTNTEMRDAALGLFAWASPANLDKVLGGES